MGDLQELQRLNALLDEVERRRAKDSLAIYCGLHIPAEIEAEDFAGQDKLPIAARYVPAAHHRLQIDKLEAVERGEIKRLMIFAPPGSAKSSYGSVMFPAWYLGRNPTHNIGQGSYNDTLAAKFGKRARNTFASEIHYAVFGVGLAKDSRAAGDWETERGGEYFSFGVNVGVTGHRFDGVVLDDLIKGRNEADSKTVRDSTWETYVADVRTRLKPGGWITYIATRWHEDDPAGRILPPQAAGKTGWFTAKDGEKWYVISLVAVIETQEDVDNDPLGRKIGDILWPEWFTPQHFEQERRTQGVRNWQALFKQRPSAEGGSILKREYWRKWQKDKPPKCEYVVSVYDTAFEEGEENDYTARTTWGVFWHEEERKVMLEALTGKVKPPASGRYCCVLLERFKKRVEFPELRKEAREHYVRDRPDRVLVEKRASGHSLIQELRRINVPVTALKADKSKLARAHASSVVLEAGCVWYMDRNWAGEVIDECEAFPSGEHDDLTDTCVHAWNWLRKTFHLQMPIEDEDDDEVVEDKPRRLYG